MSWEDQGRQYHMWFGHGTADNPASKVPVDPSVTGMSVAQRAQAVASGALGSLSALQRRQLESQYRSGTLPRLTAAMESWMHGARLDDSAFARVFFDRSPDDEVVRTLRSVALAAATAANQSDLRRAAEKLGTALTKVGLSQWPKFVIDAQDRARQPATQAAIEASQRPPDPGKDSIRPVYPLETLLGLGAAGLSRRLAGAVAGAVLRQLRPTPKPNLPSEALRIDPYKQRKHVEGTSHFIPGRGSLTANPHELLRHFAGKGSPLNKIPLGQPGSRERFDAERIIGVYRTEDGLSAPTTRGIIHYSKRGAHIVPAKPRSFK